MDFLDFFSTKVISAVRFDPKFGFVFGFHEEAMKQNFVCNIRYGNLLKDSVDILLCPVSESNTKKLEAYEGPYERHDLFISVGLVYAKSQNGKGN